MFANNTIFSPSFYNGQRLVSTVDRDLQNNIITGYEYTYDNSDRILQEMNLADNTKICYTYDSLSRVTNRTVYDSLDEVLSSEDFEYDVYGNIITANADEHIYDINNRLVSVNNTAITYDLDGNMLSDGTLSYTYDSQNRLTSAGNCSYIYNAENVRIKKINGNDYIKYTYDTVSKLSRLLYAEDQNGNITKYIYGVGLIGQIATNELSVYHYDYRGSTVAITNGNGITTDTFDYDTYGKLLTRTGTTDIPFKYNGRDGVITDENGLLYMRARYYNPNLQRFVNADILIGDVTDFVTLNRYAYANGNPVSNVDPFGLAVERGGDISKISSDLEGLYGLAYNYYGYVYNSIRIYRLYYYEFEMRSDMRRILVFLILSIIILLSGCSKSKVKGTVVTKYGDEFIVTAKIKRDMHEQYVYYDIVGEDLDGGFFTYDHNSSNIPNNPEKEIIEIAGNDDIHVYSLKKNLFYVYNKQILWFPNNCDLNQYLSNDYFADNAERKTYLIACHTIISSKRFKYVKVCAPVLLYENDADMVSLIQNWASGIFTDDEIKINTQDGYTTSDLQQWASELLKDKSCY